MDFLNALYASAILEASYFWTDCCIKRNSKAVDPLLIKATFCRAFYVCGVNIYRKIELVVEIVIKKHMHCYGKIGTVVCWQTYVKP